VTTLLACQFKGHTPLDGVLLCAQHKLKLINYRESNAEIEFESEAIHNFGVKIEHWGFQEIIRLFQELLHNIVKRIFPMIHGEVSL